MGKTFNMVGGGGSASFSATINVTNATPNEVVTATLLNTATTYSATALADGTATILIGTMGAYNLSCADRYSPSEVSVSQSGTTYSARMLNVPIAYQEVEYIESHGTEYIDTGKIFSSSDLPIKVDAKFNLWNVSSNTEIFGAIDSTASVNGGIPTISPYSNNLRVGFMKDWTNATHSISANTWYEFSAIWSNGNISSTLNNQTITSNGTTVFAGVNNYLFATNIKGTGSANYVIGKIKEFKIYINSNVLIRDFIPCYRKSDSVVGLWDTVSKTFFTNDGTGTFIVGGDVA